MTVGEISFGRLTGDFGVWKNIPDISDAPGTSPRRRGASFAMVPYYLYTHIRVIFPVIQRHRMRPRGDVIAETRDPVIAPPCPVRGPEAGSHRNYIFAFVSCSLNSGATP
jgi:hypothetical protein